MAATRKFTDLPAHIAKVFELGSKNTGFVARAGELNGVAKANAWEFTMSQVSDLGLGADVSISEDASATAPAPTSQGRSVETNVNQILQYSAEVSYARESDTAGLTNLGEEGSQSPVDFQIDAKLKKMAKDWDWAAINGTKVVATDGATAFKMDGIVNLVTADATNLFANAGTPRALSKAIVDGAVASMFDNGTELDSPVFLVSASKKVELTNLYGTPQRSITEGGIAIDKIYTDFGIFEIIVDTHMASDKIAIVDMSVVKPVLLPRPGSSDIIVEALGKAGASTKVMVYGQVSVDFKSARAHGLIDDLI